MPGAPDVGSCIQCCKQGRIWHRDVQRQLISDQHGICRVPRQCPAAVAKLIEDCQARDPKDRPTAPEVLHRLLSLQEQGMPTVQPDSDLTNHNLSCRILKMFICISWDLIFFNLLELMSAPSA